MLFVNLMSKLKLTNEEVSLNHFIGYEPDNQL